MSFAIYNIYIKCTFKNKQSELFLLNFINLRYVNT